MSHSKSKPAERPLSEAHAEQELTEHEGAAVPNKPPRNNVRHKPIPVSCGRPFHPVPDVIPGLEPGSIPR